MRFGKKLHTPFGPSLQSILVGLVSSLQTWSAMMMMMIGASFARPLYIFGGPGVIAATPAAA